MTSLHELFLQEYDKKRKPDAFAGLTLEKLVTDPELGAFRPSPTQLALVRAADGRPTMGALSPDRMLFHFNAETLPCDRAIAETCDGLPVGATTCDSLPNRLPSGRPRQVVLRTGVRAGKSFIAAMALLLSILTCKFRRLPDLKKGELPDADGMIGVRPGELVRAIIVAPLMKLSRAPLEHLIGTMKASSILSKYLIKDLEESCVIRRGDGREVTVEMVAAAGGGANLRSTWLAGVIFDEADFHDDEDAAVNLTDNLRAAMPRLLAGAQAWVPSSPWADSGPFHDLFVKHFGAPGRVLAFHSDSRSMNPTLDLEDERAERERDPENAAREYDAIPMASGGSLFFPVDAIEKSVNKDRERVLPVIAGVAHAAGADLGFRKNSSALAISRLNGGRVEVAYHEELRPEKGESLKPGVVCRGFGRKCLEYGVSSVAGDLHYADTAKEEFAKLCRCYHGADEHSNGGCDACVCAEFSGDAVTYDEWNPTTDNQSDAFAEMRRRMQEGLVDLPDDPRLVAQLKGVKSRPMPGGAIKIVLPKQGRAHGDVLMAVVLSVVRVSLDVEEEEDYRIVGGGQRRWN